MLILLKYLFAVAILVHLFSQFFALEWIQYLVSMLAIACIVSTIFQVRPFVRILGIVFLSLGFGMLWTSSASGIQYGLSFGEMLNLLSLFALVPILALPIRWGNYAASVQKMIQRSIGHSHQLYMVSSGFAFLLSSFMSVATMPMMYYSIRTSVDMFPIKNSVRFMCRSITRGFCMPLLWTPVTPIVGIVIEMTQVDWGAMLRIMLPLSLLGLFLDWVTTMLRAPRASKNDPEIKQPQSEAAATEETAVTPKRPGRLVHIFVAVLFINLLIWLGEQYFDLGFLLIVTLLVIPFSFAWCWFLGVGKDYPKGLKQHMDTHFLKMKDQFYIFLSAGFFLTAIQVSGMNEEINAVLFQVKQFLGNGVFITLVPLIPFALAFSGIHPAVALALVAQALDPQALAIHPEILTVAMLGGAVPAFLMGPYNATLGIMSNIVDESNFKLSYWNAPFTVVYIVMIMLALVFLQMMFAG